MQIAWAIGEITIALIFLIDLSWRYIACLTLIAFIAVFIIIIKFVEETPMYMAKKNED